MGNLFYYQFCSGEETLYITDHNNSDRNRHLWRRLFLDLKQKRIILYTLILFRNTELECRSI